MGVDVIPVYGGDAFDPSHPAFTIEQWRAAALRSGGYWLLLLLQIYAAIGRSFESYEQADSYVGWLITGQAKVAAGMWHVYVWLSEAGSLSYPRLEGQEAVDLSKERYRGWDLVDLFGASSDTSCVPLELSVQADGVAMYFLDRYEKKYGIQVVTALLQQWAFQVGYVGERGWHGIAIAQGRELLRAVEAEKERIDELCRRARSW